MSRSLQVIVFGVIACAQAAALLIVVGHHFGGVAPLSLTGAIPSDPSRGNLSPADVTGAGK